MNDSWVPSPRHIETDYKRMGKLPAKYVGCWVPCTEALPPERMPVLIMHREDDTPAFAWLRYAAGDRGSPFFVCPQGAAILDRGVCTERPEYGFGATHWYAPTDQGVYPQWKAERWRPEGYEKTSVVLGVRGWIKYSDDQNT